MTRPPDQPTARPADQLRADARQNHALLITAATAAFTEKGADAPLEDIARRAGVGIGTLYRHFPSRLDLQAAVFRTQVRDICRATRCRRPALPRRPSAPGFAHWPATWSSGAACRAR
jgi:AcrR family transcriptional regulator